MRELEDQLGTRLVERGPKLFRLTEEGAALHQRTRHLLAEINEAGQTLAGGLSYPRGSLRVSVPALFGDLHMGRIAAAFVARYPDVELEVLTDNRIIDPLLEGVDLVVRINPHPQENLFGRLIFREDTLLVALPSIPKPRPGKTGEAAVQVPAVTLPTSADRPLWVLEEEGGSRALAPKPALRLSSVLMAWQAVRGGAGVAALPRSVVDADLQAGRLVSWGKLTDRDIEAWVLHTSNRLRSPKVAAFVDFVCAAFPDKQAIGRASEGPG